VDALNIQLGERSDSTNGKRGVVSFWGGDIITEPDASCRNQMGGVSGDRAVRGTRDEGEANKEEGDLEGKRKQHAVVEEKEGVIRCRKPVSVGS